MTVSGEVIAKDHREQSCLVVVWQNVCKMQSQSFYVRVLFNRFDYSLQNPLVLPNLHTPISFSGALVTFEHGESVVEFDHPCEQLSLF